MIKAPAKLCGHCLAVLVKKKRGSTASYETPKQFAKRQYCDQKCHTAARETAMITRSHWWPGESVPFPAMAMISWTPAQIGQVNA